MWWKKFYTTEIADILFTRNEETVSDICTFLRDQTDISPGDHIFDQCCGVGDLTAALASRGYFVNAVDIVPGYVEKTLASIAPKDRKNCQVHIGDAFNYIPEGQYDLAINWYTSYGYSDCDEENQRQLYNLTDNLKKGGSVVIDFYNLSALLADFREVVDYDNADITEASSQKKTTIHFDTGMMESEWALAIGGRTEYKSAWIKMYMPHDIIKQLEKCGIREIRLFGDVEGSAHTYLSKRCIIIGKKL